MVKAVQTPPRPSHCMIPFREYRAQSGETPGEPKPLRLGAKARHWFNASKPTGNLHPKLAAHVLERLQPVLSRYEHHAEFPQIKSLVERQIREAFSDSETHDEFRANVPGYVHVALIQFKQPKPAPDLPDIPISPPERPPKQPPIREPPVVPPYPPAKDPKQPRIDDPPAGPKIPGKPKFRKK